MLAAFDSPPPRQNTPSSPPPLVRTHRVVLFPQDESAQNVARRLDMDADPDLPALHAPPALRAPVAARAPSVVIG